jgi:hypothetical protein
LTVDVRVVLDTDFLSAFLKIDQLPLLNIPAFLLEAKLSSSLSREQIAGLITALEERDRYGFKKDIRAELLA